MGKMQQTQRTAWFLLLLHQVSLLQAQIRFFNDATVNQGRLCVTTNKTRSIGRVMHNQPIPICSSSRNSSFTTSFVFSITNYTAARGEGMAFLISGEISEAPRDSYGQWLGLYDSITNDDSNNHLVAVEFDTVKSSNQEPNDNHVGIDINQIQSQQSLTLSNDAGQRVDLHDPLVNVSVWIDYDGSNKSLAVFVNRNDHHRPETPLLPSMLVDLCRSAAVDGWVYVGFSAATGEFSMDVHAVHSWSFNSSSTNPNASFEYRSFAANVSDWDSVLPAGEYPGGSKRKTLVIVVGTVSCALLLFILCSCTIFVLRRKRKPEDSESWIESTSLRGGDHNNLPSFPSEFSHSELKAATSSFSSSNMLGQGGFGKVYVGLLPSDQSPVAVKRISENSRQGEREFLAEVQIISKLSHRNLVQLRGWCCRSKELLLVYEYMPNGSLDKALFDTAMPLLDWGKRYEIVCGLASALAYLHEECEQRVVHRDVKPSNVMLDAGFNARLGDFGLARLVNRNRDARTTTVAGTFGYLAPELNITGQSTTASDVYSFGVVVLEVASGRRPFERLETEDNNVLLVEWVWRLYQREKLAEAADGRLRGEFDEDQLNSLMIIGLACSDPDPKGRPAMTQVVGMLRGEMPPPELELGRLPRRSTPRYELEPDFTSISIANTSSLFSTSVNVPEGRTIT